MYELRGSHCGSRTDLIPCPFPAPAGGPGKGMHSRLYTRVLNQHPWMHNCTALNSIYNNTGLVGVFASAESGQAGEMVDVLCKEMLVGGGLGGGCAGAGCVQAGLCRAGATCRSWAQLAWPGCCAASTSRGSRMHAAPGPHPPEPTNQPASHPTPCSPRRLWPRM